MHSTLHAAALLLLCPAVLGLGLKVEPKTEECFTLVVKRTQPVTFNFQVTAGGKLDIDCKLFDSNDQEIRTWNVASEGRHHWPAATSGEAKVCFSNLMSRWTPKWVSFYFTAGHDPNAARLEHLDPIESTIQLVTEGLEELQVEQRSMRAQERVHRDSIEDTNSRILWWSVFESVLMFFVGVVQVRHLKKFLEVKPA
eukprot:TRINITY_DN9575_c0_g1_i1.p1 TRINITY_DN9575_c0_g1~~TRINITY_DN9575_c0_g1_i1.p1  ORF type:complete len:197 (+),score=69.59 TRINITY_DN9575_c0_g1_i1:76-666(+)